MLYEVKRHLRGCYGAAESLVGVASCWAGLSYSSRTDLPAALAVVGGVYLIVDGIESMAHSDNVFDRIKGLLRGKNPYM